METLDVAAIRRGGLDVYVFVRALHSYLHAVLYCITVGFCITSSITTALLIRLYEEAE
jgi:hypothetical protein